MVNGNRDANGSMILGQDITIAPRFPDDAPSLHTAFRLRAATAATISCSRLTAKLRLSAPNRLRRVLCPIRADEYGRRLPARTRSCEHRRELTISWTLRTMPWALPTWSPQQRNLPLTDDLQGVQAITLGGVTVHAVVATTDAGGADRAERFSPSPTCSR
ncbi:MAG: hypothetical protein ACLSVD_00565 [Eggerthellaceae bacterium]